MILYQVAKWMEERSVLLLIMQENSGDMKTLAEKKTDVERKLLRQTELWRQGRFHLLEPAERQLKAMLEPVVVADLSQIKNRLDAHHLPEFLLVDTPPTETESFA